MTSIENSYPKQYVKRSDNWLLRLAIYRNTPFSCNLLCYQTSSFQSSLFVLDTPRRLSGNIHWEVNRWSVANRRHGNFTPLRFSQSHPHCLRRFYHARTVTGREYHYPYCLLWPYREQPNIYNGSFRSIIKKLCRKII